MTCRVTGSTCCSSVQFISFRALWTDLYSTLSAASQATTSTFSCTSTTTTIIAINLDFILCTAIYSMSYNWRFFTFICVGPMCACVLLLILIFIFCTARYCYFYNWRCMYVWYVQLNSTYLLNPTSLRLTAGSVWDYGVFVIMDTIIRICCSDTYIRPLLRLLVRCGLQNCADCLSKLDTKSLWRFFVYKCRLRLGWFPPNEARLRISDIRCYEVDYHKLSLLEQNNVNVSHRVNCGPLLSDGSFTVSPKIRKQPVVMLHVHDWCPCRKRTVNSETYCVDTPFPVFFLYRPTINCIIHYAMLASSPHLDRQFLAG